MATSSRMKSTVWPPSPTPPHLRSWRSLRAAGGSWAAVRFPRERRRPFRLSVAAQSVVQGGERGSSHRLRQSLERLYPYAMSSANQAQPPIPRPTRAAANVSGRGVTPNPASDNKEPAITKTAPTSVNAAAHPPAWRSGPATNKRIVQKLRSSPRLRLSRMTHRTIGAIPVTAQGCAAGRTGTDIPTFMLISVSPRVSSGSGHVAHPGRRGQKGCARAGRSSELGLTAPSGRGSVAVRWAQIAPSSFRRASSASLMPRLPKTSALCSPR